MKPEYVKPRSLRFREAWVKGVRQYYPGDPPARYLAGWDEIPEWERNAATIVYKQVEHFLVVSDGCAMLLNRDQRGQFIAMCWGAQMFRRFGQHPTPTAYVADWGMMAHWQRETDADIFAHIAGWVSLR